MTSARFFTKPSTVTTGKFSLFLIHSPCGCSAPKNSGMQAEAAPTIQYEMQEGGDRFICSVSMAIESMDVKESIILSYI